MAGRLGWRQQVQEGKLRVSKREAIWTSCSSLHYSHFGLCLQRCFMPVILRLFYRIVEPGHHSLTITKKHHGFVHVKQVIVDTCISN